MESLKKVKIAWYGKHFGEEPPLVGKENQGAGGIFFSGCNLKCAFCQNYQISQNDLGQEYSVQELVEIMLGLQAEGAVNIDLVTPTIWWKQLVEAIKIAKENGLKIPVVWNSNAYEALPILQAMNGLVDIYLPDFKYADDDTGYKYSGIKKYSSIAVEAIREMLRQVGNFNSEKNKGVIVRHLVLPGNIENSLRALDVLAGIDTNLYISLMSQYFPTNRSAEFPEIDRRLEQEEFDEVYNHLLKLGFSNGWAQDCESGVCFVPDFTKPNPFGNVGD